MTDQETTTDTFIDRLDAQIEVGLERAKELGRQVLISVTEPIEPVDPLTFFTNAAAFATERWYWDEPTRDTAFVAVGVTSGTMPPRRVRFQRSDSIRQEVMDHAVVDPPVGDDNPGPIFFAGFSFDPERKPDWRLWQGFPAAYFLVPRATLARRGERYFMTYNMLTSPTRDLEALRDIAKDFRRQVHTALTREPSEPTYEIGIAPDEEGEADRLADEFRTAVTTATEAVKKEQFEKVVVARHRDIKAKLAFHPAGAIAKLRQDYPNCYIFAIARHSTVFLGASPEQLVKLDGDQVDTVCLAGSIKRGETPDEDEQLGQQLLTSSKDRHEHDVGVRAIREALEPLCSELDVPDSPGLMTVSNVHHLRTPIHGQLANGATLLQLVERLHPTPAVGGYPKDAALQFLRENETFDRGWYAAPLGWVDGNGNGEFIVALRSALVRSVRAYLFAGCGIVDESDPEQELAESEVKMQPMLAALDGPSEDENDNEEASEDGPPGGDEPSSET